MERTHVSRRALLVGAALGSLGHQAHAGSLPRAALFVIARSKNANVIHYDARVQRPGMLDRAEPVVAYWVMHAENGRCENLTWLERKFAYGWSVSFDARGELRLRLSACSQREIRVFPDGNGVFRALTRIAARPALLERIYVASDEHGAAPSVRYVDLIGVTHGDGRRVSERIVP